MDAISLKALGFIIRLLVLILDFQVNGSLKNREMGFGPSPETVMKRASDFANFLESRARGLE